ncbi:ComF family protein [Planctomicrobium sp. SH664]|uniref:ComF family protein n=1 Tax=Planctomicrobium sp. SH664 TaxID=3448125 RepID=UPI003F5C7EE7
MLPLWLPLWLRELASATLDFMYPPACRWCGEQLPQSTKPQSFCDGCLVRLFPPPPHTCERCSAPVGPHLQTLSGCIHCRHEKHAYEQVVSLGAYDGELRGACVRSKQNYQAPLAGAMADLLVSRAQSRFQAWAAHFIVPIPHFWLDRMTHLHHPGDTVADQLHTRLGIPVERHILAKVRRTPKQHLLKQTARRNNLQGAFRVRRGVRLRGESVLLVDDVLTTGTTAHRAAKVLKQAGAGKVFVAVLARSLHRS